MSKLKLAAIIALLAGPFVIVTNYMEISNNKRIDSEGIETSAVPMAKIERRGRRGGRTYKLEIAFAAQDGSQRTEQVSVSHGLYERADAMPAIQIKYLQDDPAEVIVVGEPLGSPDMYWVGLALLAVGGGGCWWFFLRKRPVLNAEPERA